MSQSHHTASDPLIFRQLGYWPYPSGNQRGTISLPYVQLRVDVHVRPLQDIEDSSIDMEIYQRESWQNQMCAQRILKLLRYCTDKSDPNVEMCPRAVVKVTGEVYDLASAFIAAKESTFETFPFAALPPRDMWPDCECPLDVLLWEILTLNPADHLASRVDPPPSLAFLAREALVRSVPDMATANAYLYCAWDEGGNDEWPGHDILLWPSKTNAHSKGKGIDKLSPRRDSHAHVLTAPWSQTDHWWSFSRRK